MIGASGEQAALAMLSLRWVGGQWGETPATMTVQDSWVATDQARSVQITTDRVRWLSNEPVNRWIQGIDIRYTSAAPRSGMIMGLEHNDGVANNLIVQLRRSADSSVQIVVNGGATLATGPVSSMTPFVGDFYELDCVAGTSTGSVSCWIAGNEVLRATDVDTLGNATATTYNQVNLPGNEGVMEFTNMRVWDGLGTEFNEPLGLITQNKVTLVDGNGALSEWVSNGTATNFEQVDEDIINDGNTTVVETDVYGDADLYTVGGLPSTVDSTHGLQVTAVGRLSAGGDAGLKILCESNGTTASGGDAVPGGQQGLAGSLLWINEIFETDPDTGVAWLATAVNGHQPGMRLASAT